jgi:predicted RNA-binding protein with PUA-like domain
MDERVARTIANTVSFEALAQFERNARERKAITEEMEAAIRKRSGELGRSLIGDRTGLDLSDLSPAEDKIVEAVSAYVGVMKRQGKDATRTIEQLKNRGLIGAAETAVAKAKPTQGFQTLSEEGRVDLSYEQIILDYPEEFSPRAIWYSRRTLGLPNDAEKPPAQKSSLTQGWTETLLSWLATRSAANGGRIPQFSNADVAVMLGMSDMHKFGRPLGNMQSRIDFACYRAGLPPLGLAAKSPFDLAWGQEGRDWPFPVDQMQAAAQTRAWSSEDFRSILSETDRLSGQAHLAWKRELLTNEASVKSWAYGLEASETPTENSGGKGTDAHFVPQATDNPSEAPYWVFVCNPKKWAIDLFLGSRIELDSWGVRKSDRDRFAPGQLAVIRVGTDQRTIAEREGRPKLDPGIYALCEVDSTAFPATGAASEFWSEEAAREPGWPTVQIRYLRTYLDAPLTIERLRTEAPDISHLLLDGFQASSFPISAADFRTVLKLLGEDEEDIPPGATDSDISSDRLAELERKYLGASPEVKERLSKSVERGPVGALVKKANGYRCQICEALGLNPIGFLKRNGTPYVEAHHVTPVAKREVGTLSASNVITVCANHHREIHYGKSSIRVNDTTFDIDINECTIRIARVALKPIP